MSAEYLEDNTDAILSLMSTLTLLICNKSHKICNIGYRHPLNSGQKAGESRFKSGKGEQLQRLLIPGYFVAVLIDIFRGGKVVLFFKYF